MDPGFFLILLMLIFVGGTYIYDHFFRLNVEVHFVTINDSNCNCHTNSSRRCNNKNCPSKMMSNIISKIAKAKKSIDIAMYNFTNSDLARAVLKAYQRGVLIRIIVDKSADENEDNHSQVVELLRNEGIDIRVFGISSDDGKKLMHHKFCVIDHSSADGIVITGSLNWSYTAFKQCEDVLFISSVPIQKQYKAEFAGIWWQTVNPNASTRIKKVPMDQRNLWTRRQNQIGYRNGGY